MYKVSVRSKLVKLVNRVVNDKVKTKHKGSAAFMLGRAYCSNSDNCASNCSAPALT